jgi:hypothetical protein
VQLDAVGEAGAVQQAARQFERHRREPGLDSRARLALRLRARARQRRRRPGLARSRPTARRSPSTRSVPKSGAGERRAAGAPDLLHLSRGPSRGSQAVTPRRRRRPRPGASQRRPIPTGPPRASASRTSVPRRSRSGPTSSPARSRRRTPPQRPARRAPIAGACVALHSIGTARLVATGGASGAAGGLLASDPNLGFGEPTRSRARRPHLRLRQGLSGPGLRPPDQRQGRIFPKEFPGSVETAPKLTRLQNRRGRLGRGERRHGA